MGPTDGGGSVRSGDGDMPGRTAARAVVSSAATARAYTEAVVRGEWDAAGLKVRDEDVIDLLLVVSELVTNAIRHGGGLAGFMARTTAEGVRIAVDDHSDIVPEAAFGSGALPLGHHGNGYGWPLIIRLARDIAVDRRPGGGKTVSVLVPMRNAPGSAPRTAGRL